MLLRIKFLKESGKEPIDCCRGFCTFDFCLVCSEERFFGQGILVIMGSQIFFKNIIRSPVDCEDDT